MHAQHKIDFVVLFDLPSLQWFFLGFFFLQFWDVAQVAIIQKTN
jgi:hypothetical protein